MGPRVHAESSEMKSVVLCFAAFAFISLHVESYPTADQSWIDAGQVDDDLDNDPRLPVACLLVMLHEPTEYPGIQRIKDEAKQKDPELYQAAQELHLMSDEEKMALIESRTEWGWAKKMAKKGISAAKSYVNKNKGKWMKKAAGMAKNWYNKQGKKVLGKMLKKAGNWAKSKGIPAGLVDKAQAMAAKGADSAVAAGAKRLGAEELLVSIMELADPTADDASTGDSKAKGKNKGKNKGKAKGKNGSKAKGKSKDGSTSGTDAASVASMLIMLHEPAIYPGVQQIKDKVMQYDPELYQGAQNLHLMSDYEKLDFIESQWGLIKRGFKAAKGYVNKNKGKWMKAAAGAAGKWYKKSGKKLLGKMLNKAGEWAKSKGIPAGLVDKAKAMAAKGADKGVAMGLKRAGRL